MTREQKLERALEKARRALGHWPKYVFNDNGDIAVTGGVPYEPTVDAYFALREIDAALSHEGEAKAQVKPLEWQQGNDGPRYEYSTGGEYQVYFTGSNAETVLTFGARRVHVGRFSGDAVGQKARAAAQADYEARVLSAIDASATPKVEIGGGALKLGSNNTVDCGGADISAPLHGKKITIRDAHTSPAPAITDEAVERVREDLRLTMLRQPFTEGNDTYSDGFGKGIAYALSKIDALTAAFRGGDGMNNEQVAILLWERFSPEHEITWPSAHASEYRLAASDIIEKLDQRSHGAASVPKEAPEAVARKIAIDIARGCSADRVDGALDALADAGYRLLAPGELDGETLEAAAQVADKRAAMAGTVSHEAARALLVALPDAIRALKASPAETDGEIERLRAEKDTLARALFWFAKYPEFKPNPYMRDDWLADLEAASPLLPKCRVGTDREAKQE